MKVLVIGLGSMGTRRIRLIQKTDPNVEIAGVDTQESRRQKVKDELGIDGFDDLQKAIADFSPDAAFICTSPISHGAIALQCLKSGLNIFTEINLLNDWYDEALKTAKEKNCKMFLSSTFLYRKEIEYITKAVENKKVNYIYHSGQYLPDWHPWESYKNFFVSDKRTNACREILAIEFPWLIKAFGEITDVYSLKSKNTSLDVDFPDNYIIVLQHKNGNKGVFCQDIVARKSERKLEVYAEDLHLFWNGTPQSLSVYDFNDKKDVSVNVYDDVSKDNRYAANIIENAYQDEIKSFFNYLKGTETPRHSFEKDGEILDLVSKIEGVK